MCIISNSTIQNGGINNSEHPWNDNTGYSRSTKGFDIVTEQFIKKAYLALYNLLDDEYFRKKNDELGNILSFMSPYTFQDLNSADPAYYSDFCRFIKKYNIENSESAYKASVDFLTFYHTEFDFQIKEYIDKLTPEKYSEYFDKSENKTDENIQQYKF